MIDISTEPLIALADVPTHPSLPKKRRGGRGIHVSCVYRWAQRGCKGVRLEVVQVGGTKCTSVAALSRFFAALGGEQDQPSPRSPKSKRAATERAKAELTKAGW